MKCKVCNGTETIKVNKPEHVKFICKKGHSWTEDYCDSGGSHKRPPSYEIKLDDVLFPGEKILYKRILKEIAKNQRFFLNSSAEEIASYLVDTCKMDRNEVYSVLRKVSKYSNPQNATNS